MTQVIPFRRLTSTTHPDVVRDRLRQSYYEEFGEREHLVPHQARTAMMIALDRGDFIRFDHFIRLLRDHLPQSGLRPVL